MGKKQAAKAAKQGDLKSKNGKQAKAKGISAPENAPEADFSDLAGEEETPLPLDLSVTVSRETLEGTPTVETPSPAPQAA